MQPRRRLGDLPRAYAALSGSPAQPTFLRLEIEVAKASEVFRALGCTLGFSAGLSQRFAVLKIRELTASAA